MKANRLTLLKGLATLALLLVSSALLAQPGGGPPVGGGEPTCWPPPCIPIDGGMSFLLAAGLAFGGKKLFDLRSK
jgi:hypothetical protein